MFSFYHLPSTVMNHPVHKTLYVAYLFYCFSTVTPLKDLLYDALVQAKKVSHAGLSSSLSTLFLSAERCLSIIDTLAGHTLHRL